MSDAHEWTIGVEQEFLLVDPGTGRPVPRSREVAEKAGEVDGVDVQMELTPYQIEAATGVCGNPAQLAEQVRLGRRTLAEAATQVGARLVAVGGPPLGSAGPPPGIDHERYEIIEREHRLLAAGQGVCGCHIHVGVPDDDTAIAVCNGIRPWLPVLLALSANSPIKDGADTGYASWRSMIWSRWPISGPPPRFESMTEYRGLVRALVTSGAVIDEGMIYWDVRPSGHLPTVEIRVADIPGLASEVDLLADLVVALAATIADGRGSGLPEVPDVLLRAAAWRAARDGLEGAGVDLGYGRPVRAWDQVAALVDHVEPVLRARGRLDAVHTELDRLRREGSGAHRQRRLLRAHADPRELLTALASQTTRP